MELKLIILCVLVCGMQSHWNEVNDQQFVYCCGHVVPRKGNSEIHHKQFLKTNIPYYCNSCACFNIQLLEAGDIQPNPGPDTNQKQVSCESEKEARIEYTRGDLLRFQYGGQAVINDDSLKKIRELGIERISAGLDTSIKKRTRRGCRGGTRKQKKATRDLKGKPIPVLVTNSERLFAHQPQPRTSCLRRIPLERMSTHGSNCDLPSVYMTNVRSLNNKFDEFSCTVQEMDIDLVCVSETWFKDNTPQNVFNIPEYVLFSKNRNNKQGGGVALYAKVCLNPMPAQVTTPEDLEILWVQIRPRRLPRTVSSVFVASVYLPPDNVNDHRFVQSLVTSLDDIFTDHPGVGIIIAGDLNRLNIAPLLNAHKLKQVVNLPTRNDVILDKILTNLDVFYKPVDLVSPVGLSDHNGITWRPKQRQLQKNKVIRKFVRPMRESSIRNFGDWITHKDWTNVYSLPSVEAKCEAFYSDLNSAIELHFPMKSVKMHICDKPWITVRVKSLIKQRQTAFYENSPTWPVLRNKVQKAIKRAKKSFYRDRVQNLKRENPRSWYQYIKIMTSNVNQELSLSVPDVDPNDLEAIANAINTHFVNISEASRLLDPVHLPAFRPYMPSTIPSVQPWTVYRELLKTKVGKSGGPDGISSRLIREYALELSTPLCHIMNVSFQQGVVPSTWKKSIIVPLPKESPPSIDKLRPIALTDHFAKLLELFVYRWLIADIGKNIDPQQFGNRHGMSTSHYLISLVDYLQACADKPNTVTTIILTDFSKAFDLVDHNVALNKLYAMGARPSLIQWLASFLANRTQQVRYRGKLSSTLTTRAGVPQGTRLGPLIFPGVVNEALRSSQIQRWKYVDDLTLAQCRRLDTADTLETVLSEFEQWCVNSCMRLNPLKCKTLRVAFTRQQLPPPQIHLSNQTIPCCDQVKLLGVIIKNDLKWDEHVNYITSKASRKLYLIRMLKRFGMPLPDLTTVFTSYIRPILEYCCVVWHSSLTQQQIAAIESIQKRALRLMLGKEYESYELSMKRCTLVTLKDRRDELCQKFALQLFKNFRDWLPPARLSHRELRNSHRLTEIRCRTERYRKSALPYLVRLLNSKL